MVPPGFACTLIFAAQVLYSQQPASGVQVASQAPEPKVESSGQETASSGVLIVTKDGFLTVNVHRAPLGSLLGELGRRAKLSIVVDDDIVNTRVSIELQKVPVLDGLAQILSPYDAFYLHSADRSAPAVISRVWVYARGVGRLVEPVPTSPWASSKELAERLNDEDEAARVRSYEALLERQGDKAVETVLKALTDTSPQVREVALSAAVDAEIEVPSSDDLLFVRALLDGVVMQPGQVQFSGDDDEDNEGRWSRSHNHQWIGNVNPGPHTITMQFWSFDGGLVVLHSKTLTLTTK